VVCSLPDLRQTALHPIMSLCYLNNDSMCFVKPALRNTTTALPLDTYREAVLNLHKVAPHNRSKATLQYSRIHDAGLGFHKAAGGRQSGFMGRRATSQGQSPR
jgi:hypothetical protein